MSPTHRTGPNAAGRTTRPQAATTLHEQLVGAIVVGPRARRILTWCDWIDDLHSRPPPETTVVHGDLHAHNMVVSEDGERLLLVADFENAAFGDPHYDFRYLVSMRRDLRRLAELGVVIT